jgi:hypothetical protein
MGVKEKGKGIGWVVPFILAGCSTSYITSSARHQPFHTGVKPSPVQICNLSRKGISVAKYSTNLRSENNDVRRNERLKKEENNHRIVTFKIEIHP